MVSLRYISGVCKQNKTTLSVAQDGPKIKLQKLVHIFTNIHGFYFTDLYFPR